MMPEPLEYCGAWTDWSVSLFSLVMTLGLPSQEESVDRLLLSR